MTVENLGAAGGGLLKLDRLEIASRSVDGVELGLSRGQEGDRASFHVSARLEAQLLRHLEPFARRRPARDIEEAG